MFNYQAITIFFALRFVSLRFFTSFSFRLQRFKLTNKIAFLAAFLAVSRVFLSFLCVCLCRHKRPLFWPFLRVKFSMHPQPLIDPHRDRGCLSENFFFKFFLSVHNPLSASLQIFFENFFFPPSPFYQFYFFIFLFSASYVALLVVTLFDYQLTFPAIAVLYF